MVLGELNKKPINTRGAMLLGGQWALGFLMTSVITCFTRQTLPGLLVVEGGEGWASSLQAGLGALKLAGWEPPWPGACSLNFLEWRKPSRAEAPAGITASTV